MSSLLNKLVRYWRQFAHITISAFFASLLANANAASLSILTEIDPPAQFFNKDGELTGFTIELVQAIQKIVGNQDPITPVPWARAYRMIETQPNVVLFLMVRDKNRAPLFQWIGPVLEFTTGLYGLSDSELVLSSLTDAKKLPAIGVYKNDIRDQTLTNLGFGNLERVTNKTQNIRMLMAGRIDAYAASSISFGADAIEAGFRPDDLKLIFPINNVQAFIAMSKQTPIEIVDEWRNALAKLIDDGTLSILLNKYYPGAPMPSRVSETF
ncbi:ABC transporter substrate-binding protein [Reinekea sp. G2M2-21]|uniref:substrate-binding periplasmic protein n=1 Tax=Reinekea sp. G2M2-21 TaxID=2788942 RepID=UPI0018A958F4|nr:transporter substrate-binding domain-containing protein [Reinekea sp. G2M2-21]